MKKLAIIFFGVFALSSAAQASTYDFTAEGNAGENGYAVFNSGIDSVSGMDPGLTITASSTLIPDVAAVYMDANSGGPGGLGVCSKGPGTACAGDPDDNHSTSNSEGILMSWGALVDLVSIKIIGNHVAVPISDAVNGTTFLDWTTDTETGSINISGANQTVFDLSLLADTTSLAYSVSNSLGKRAEIYVMSLTTIPVPAAVWLFGTAMLGLFGMRRKAKLGAVAA